jgi:hypothetical protein
MHCNATHMKGVDLVLAYLWPISCAVSIMHPAAGGFALSPVLRCIVCAFAIYKGMPSDH